FLKKKNNIIPLTPAFHLASSPTPNPSSPPENQSVFVRVSSGGVTVAGQQGRARGGRTHQDSRAAFSPPTPVQALEPRSCPMFHLTLSVRAYRGEVGPGDLSLESFYHGLVSAPCPPQ
uniref:Uncharacterized protein n=1 Tax=Cebus imitator TaxID=2715852 RepID=A0A2K5PBD2_CEBIM